MTVCLIGSPRVLERQTERQREREWDWESATDGEWVTKEACFHRSPWFISSTTFTTTWSCIHSYSHRPLPSGQLFQDAAPPVGGTVACLPHRSSTELRGDSEGLVQWMSLLFACFLPVKPNYANTTYDIGLLCLASVRSAALVIDMGEPTEVGLCG